MLLEINETLICLKLKRSIPTKATNYRPIRLCNEGYKIIAKLLAGRIKPFLSKFISSFQSAFSSATRISKNVILAQEIVHTTWKKKRKWSFNGHKD